MQEKKRKPLDWRTVADAAIALADEVGLERLSLRAVAARLHVTPMALYKHVHDKAELDAIVSAEVLDRSMRELVFPQDAQWREILRASFLEMHRAFQLRPAMLHVFIQYPFHPKSQYMGNLIQSALMRAGLDETRAFHLFSMLSIMVVGEILTRHHYAKGRTSSGFDKARRENAPYPPVANPTLTRGVMDFDVLFDLQLDLVELEISRSAAAAAKDASQKGI